MDDITNTVISTSPESVISGVLERKGPKFVSGGPEKLAGWSAMSFYRALADEALKGLAPSD
jgi:hypothetical protein